MCTATNCTPHERLFSHQRRSASGNSIPTWLTTQEKVLLKRHVRKSKYDPLVDEVDLIDVNPEYAHVRLSDGKESTVSVRDLAPCGIISDNNTEQVNAYDEGIKTNSRPDQSQSHEISADMLEISIDKDSVRDLNDQNDSHAVPSSKDESTCIPTFKTSQRNRRPPDRLEV